jgi:hypothetical protein
MTSYQRDDPARFCPAFIKRATVCHQSAQEACLLMVAVLTYRRHSTILASLFAIPGNN